MPQTRTSARPVLPLTRILLTPCHVIMAIRAEAEGTGAAGASAVVLEASGWQPHRLQPVGP